MMKCIELHLSEKIVSTVKNLFILDILRQKIVSFIESPIDTGDDSIQDVNAQLIDQSS